MEEGSGGSEVEPEVLVMDEPGRPGRRLYLVFVAIFIASGLVIAANWGYLSEIIKEDREGPDITPIMTRSGGFGQKVKFTVDDDRNLPLKVQIRVHFWNTTDESVNKTKWPVHLVEDLEVPRGTTVIRTLPYLPHKDRWSESLYLGWYVWVDATDQSGKRTTDERCVFPTEWDPDW